MFCKIIHVFIICQQISFYFYQALLFFSLTDFELPLSINNKKRIYIDLKQLKPKQKLTNAISGIYVEELKINDKVGIKTNLYIKEKKIKSKF